MSPHIMSQTMSFSKSPKVERQRKAKFSVRIPSETKVKRDRTLPILDDTDGKTFVPLSLINKINRKSRSPTERLKNLVYKSTFDNLLG